jgi:segregation and condensation protein B
MSTETGAADDARQEEPQQQNADEGAVPSAQDAASPTGAVVAEQPDQAAVKRVVEALLFSSERPVSAGRLAELSGAGDGRQAREIVKELQRDYEASGRAFAIEEIAGGFQLLTRPEFAPYVSRLRNRQEQESLTKAALETLAIVAYRQPVTRAAVEDIRGVQSGHILRSLVEKRLLKVAGKSEELGRPLLYGTTRYFLEAFGLRSLSDLPKRAEFGPAPQLQPKAEPQAEAEPERAPAEAEGAEGEEGAEGADGAPEEGAP